MAGAKLSVSVVKTEAGLGSRMFSAVPVGFGRHSSLESLTTPKGIRLLCLIRNHGLTSELSYYAQFNFRILAALPASWLQQGTVRVQRTPPRQYSCHELTSWPGNFALNSPTLYGLEQLYGVCFGPTLKVANGKA